MKKIFPWLSTIGAFVLLRYFCELFSYELISPVRNNVSHVLLAFAVVGVVHVAAFLLFTWQDFDDAKKFRLSSLAVLVAIVVMRTATARYQMDFSVSTVAQLVRCFAVEVFPLVLLFHGSLHLLLCFVVQRVRRSCGKGNEVTVQKS